MTLQGPYFADVPLRNNSLTLGALSVFVVASARPADVKHALRGNGHGWMPTL